jgi:predicted DNA-binding transcriptional regulator AlpA
MEVTAMTGKEVVNWKGIKALGIPYSRTHVWRLVASGEFPKPFKLGSHRNSPPVWRLQSVLDWLEEKEKAAA